MFCVLGAADFLSEVKIQNDGLKMANSCSKIDIFRNEKLLLLITKCAIKSFSNKLTTNSGRFKIVYTKRRIPRQNDFAQKN